MKPIAVTVRQVNEYTKRFPCSIGEIEALAGIDPANRKALWDQFNHLYTLPHPAAMNAVMRHCKSLIAKRVNAGELTLWSPWMQGGAA